MTDLLLYLLKAAIINAIILAFYYFTLKRSSKFRLMRGVLLASMVFPLLLPLIPLDNAFVESNIKILPTINLPVQSLVIQPGDIFSNITRLSITEIVYYMVSMIFLTGMLLSVISILIKRIKSDKHTTEFGCVLLEKSTKSPFSFFNWVFLSRIYLSHPQLHLLLKHEFTHVKEMHSIDRIISAIFRASLWFSPFAHITANQLIDVHEYQADDCVVRKHSTKSEYSDLILSFYLSPMTTRGITNNFSFHIKKRILMINNFNTAKVNLIRVMIGLCLSLLFISLTAMVRTGSLNLPQQQILPSVDEMVLRGDTVFPAPDLTAWITEIEKKSPEGYEGNSLISFWVEIDGSISDIMIVESAGDVLDNFAINMIKKITDWQPATISGKAVRCKVDIPFEFTADGNAKVKLLKGGAIFKDKIHQKQTEDRGPLYPGGDAARTEYIIANTPYPEDAKNSKIEGTVYVQFLIESTGKVTNVKVIKGVSPSIDKVALEAVKNMPDWLPAIKGNKPISYEMAMPIKFSLSDIKESKINDNHSGYSYEKEVSNPVSKVKEIHHVYNVADEIPEYPGGDNARSEFIQNNLVYPKNAIKEEIEGTVYITFVVEADGSITEPKILRGIGGGLDEAALEIIKKMPKWKPGKIKGEAVAVQFNMPIKFKLQEEQEDK